jgi:hypothetical protein
MLILIRLLDEGRGGAVFRAIVEVTAIVVGVHRRTTLLPGEDPQEVDLVLGSGPALGCRYQMCGLP